MQILSGRSAGVAYRVTLRFGPFDPKGRRCTWDRSTGGMYPRVDGRGVWGDDGAQDADRLLDAETYLRLRRTQIKLISVEVGGRAWPVPQTLTFDLLDPHLNDRSFPFPFGQAWLSKRGDRLVLKQLGSDGAGSYSAYFVLRRNGSHERRIYVDGGRLAERRRVQG